MTKELKEFLSYYLSGSSSYWRSWNGVQAEGRLPNASGHVWTIESDTMGMSKMLKDTRFCFMLEKVGDAKTKVIAETYYQPANLIARIMNSLMMRKMISKAQDQIL